MLEQRLGRDFAALGPARLAADDGTGLIELRLPPELGKETRIVDIAEIAGDALGEPGRLSNPYWVW